MLAEAHSVAFTSALLWIIHCVCLGAPCSQAAVNLALARRYINNYELVHIVMYSVPWELRGGSD